MSEVNVKSIVKAIIFTVVCHIMIRQHLSLPQRRLRELRLSHNNLTTLRLGSLMGLTALSLLDLSHNALAELPDGALAEAPQLTVLLLAHNRWGLGREIVHFR